MEGNPPAVGFKSNFSKTVAFVTLLAFTSTSTIAYTDSASVSRAFASSRNVSHLGIQPLVNSEETYLLQGKKKPSDRSIIPFSEFQKALEAQKTKSPRELIKNADRELSQLPQAVGMENVSLSAPLKFVKPRAELRVGDGEFKTITAAVNVSNHSHDIEVPPVDFRGVHTATHVKRSPGGEKRRVTVAPLEGLSAGQIALLDKLFRTKLLKGDYVLIGDFSSGAGIWMIAKMAQVWPGEINDDKLRRQIVVNAKYGKKLDE